VAALVELGLLPPQSQPPPDLPTEPPAEEQANTLALDTALAEAGIAPNPTDSVAIAELAKLDPAVIDAIARWVQRDENKE
jgi:hypothetical protein